MASFRDKVKKNIPKVDFQSYNIIIAGDEGTGKTRAWKELMELMYPDDPDAGLLVPFEQGYSTWEIPSIFDMYNNPWEDFQNLVKDLVEEAKGKRTTKVIGIDTVDRMVKKCTDWVLTVEAQKRFGRKYADLQEMQRLTKSPEGYTMLTNELNKQYELLNNAGYGLIWLLWTKPKQKETIDGVVYEQLDFRLSDSVKHLFQSQSHLTCVLHNEITVYDKQGNALEENEKNAKDKVIAAKKHDKQTYMYFRDSDFIGCTKGRFVNLPEKVPYSAQNFMKVFEDAVKGQLNQNHADNFEQIKKEEIKNREENARVFAESQGVLSVEEYHQKIGELTSKLSKDKIVKLAPEINELHGKNTYKECLDIEILKEIVELVEANL